MIELGGTIEATALAFSRATRAQLRPAPLAA